MTTNKIALVTLALLLSTGASTRPTIAASSSASDWSRPYEQWWTCKRFLGNENQGEVILSKPALDWSDNDIVIAVGAHKDCWVKLRAAQINDCVRRGSRLDWCERYVSPISKAEYFEAQFRRIIMDARNLNNQRKAQQAAQIELANAEAQRRRNQAEKNAQQKQEQLREQTQLADIEAQRARDQATKDAQQKQEQLLALPRPH
jgi:hypothetical protein